MKIELKFVELHSPLFLGGKNFGLKLDHSKHPGIFLVYDRAEKELLVTWKGPAGEYEGIVPLTNVVCMAPGAPEVKPAIAAVASPMVGTIHKPTAQVSSPQSHVHAGLGAGQTGQEKPKGKVIL